MLQRHYPLLLCAYFTGLSETSSTLKGLLRSAFTRSPYQASDSGKALPFVLPFRCLCFPYSSFVESYWELNDYNA